MKNKSQKYWKPMRDKKPVKRRSVFISLLGISVFNLTALSKSNG